jgi:hypothetical protein|tara:strand:- start:83 stop:655 length:573 start_codon:yes stop_codon:yes gene_type:complete
MFGNAKFSLLILVFFLSGCAGGGGISRNQCGSQQDCGHQITYWQNAIDTVAQANFPDEKFNAIVHHKDFKNAWVTSGNNINITGLLLDTLKFDQMVAVAAHEIAHLKIHSSNHLEVDRAGIDYLVKAGMHEKDFLSLLYWMQKYCMDNHDRSCSAYITYLERIEQIENSMSTADWRLALPDLEKLLKMGN